MSTLPSPPLPAPLALRLLSRGGASRVKPPLGLARWDDAAPDLALLLDRPKHGGAPTLDEIAGETPLPGTLPPGTLVLILGEVAPKDALIGRWLGPRVRVPRHLRGSALLARGYVRLGAGIDASGNDLAWGYAGDEAPA